ncbi:hypothetical protein Sjap_012698 [Stephania japonica]|uniref:DNA-directed RNA polymerase subunit n=1 Tax=Stephania japonica TaxID=461633 RepID=A0AAP0IWJ0_9MAGN
MRMRLDVLTQETPFRLLRFTRAAATTSVKRFVRFEEKSEQSPKRLKNPKTRTLKGATECVEAVKFGVLTDEEVRRLSCMKITNPTLFDQLDTPKPGGLYDPALGSLDEFTPCKSCGLRSLHCPGHCGHIDLVLPVYNPLLFKNLFDLLQKSCFFCHHFKDEEELVERYSSQLELIIKGDIVGAKNLDSLTPDELLSLRENDSVNVNDATCHSRTHEFETKHLEQHSWTSIQHGEAMSLLDGFMKRKKKSCGRCGAKSPTITCPTFGWIYLDMRNKRIRENVILGSKLMQPSLGESIVDSDDVESSGVVYDEMSASVTKKGKKNKGSLPVEFLKQTKVLSGPLLPIEAKRYIELLWENENRLCSLISNIQHDGFCTPENRGSYSMFFIEALVVPPIKFRPPSKGGISVMEHPQTALLSKVLQCNLSLGLRDNIGIGVCQLLEKKEGIFRQKLMGKRVNYACRSVISPDPYLAVNEIGIPPYFALRLTYPERVTPWNVTKLRNAIINGPEVHPGATLYVDKFGKTNLAPSRKSRNSISRKLPSSRGVVVQPGKSLENELEGKVVHRHLQDGDVVLVNRQPTLHKPSIMAHVVRVLKGEKTIRMHYANCSTYNADFDGDEMNVHFPQDEISRAEALNIVNADNQYIIPTSGDTKRGLIQDHIVSAVLLTKRDTFLTWEEYDYLLCASGVNASARVGSIRQYGRKVSLLNTADEIQYLEPAILKPVPLWTGKQVITSILNHLTRIRGLKPFTTKKPSTIRKEYFGRQSGEGKFFVLNNYLVHGVIDKSQFGKYGLVHTIQELYGSHTAGVLLSTLSRLFTIFLQMHGFTCGVDDLLIVKSLDKVRKKIFERRVGEKVHAEFLGYKEDLDIRTLQEEIEKVMRVNGESATARLDKMMSSRNAKLTNEVNDKLFPSNSSPIGLLKPFPRNCFFLMTASGAKGSQVNFQQISSLLGQQELEGKRVPRMISGKTLPCFPPWDPSSRAGGFISDRYLTGLRPQEYYFHCMAGREGLVIPLSSLMIMVRCSVFFFVVVISRDMLRVVVEALETGHKHSCFAIDEY